jgi:type IV fimbrial biogenesis protein FimT
MKGHAIPRQSGITLIELIVALAIVATIAAFATRGASAAINASRSSNSVSMLYASLARARSFAASAGVDVVLCPSTDGATCAAGYHWEQGWIVFPALHSGSNRTSDEPILVRQEALPPKVHLITSAGRTRIRFQPSGGNAGSNATFTLCDGRGTRAAAAYVMANNGSLRPTTPSPSSADQACRAP